MNDTDTYLTLKARSAGLYKQQGSRFLSFAFPVSSTEEIKKILDEMRREYYDARHHCYAYMLRQDRSVWRVSDDGEPSGTAGKPILGQINSFGLTNILIVVIRYFGGKLLGVSGLINAYRTAAADAIRNGEIVESVIYDFYELKFPYPAMNEVMRIIKDEGLNQSGQRFEETCSVIIGVRISSRERITSLLNRIDNLVCTFLYTL